MNLFNSDESIEQYVIRQNKIAERVAISLHCALDAENATDYQAVTAAAMLVASCISKSTHRDPNQQQALLDNITEYITMLSERMSQCVSDVDNPQKV